MAALCQRPPGSRIGGLRSTQVVECITTETFVESMRPSASLRGHLTFHLKHEVLHLELLTLPRPTVLCPTGAGVCATSCAAMEPCRIR